MMVIVDTNVARLANGEWGKDFKECEESCINWLERIMQGEMKLVLDMEWIILGEYSDNLHSRGADVGDRFLAWSLRNRTNPEQCDLVSITPVANLEMSLKSSQKIQSWKTSIRTIEYSSRLPINIHKNRPSCKRWIASGWISATRSVGMV